MKRLKCIGGKHTASTTGTVLVLPTGDPLLLPLYNEYSIGRSGYTEGVYSFSNDLDSNTGLKNLNKSWIAVYNSLSGFTDFFLFTRKPQNLSIKVDSLGIITEITLYSGNGLIYHDSLNYPAPIVDSDDDLIPDCIKSKTVKFVTSDSLDFVTSDGNIFHTVNIGDSSLYKFLDGYGMVN
jgi:hypothetical protein